TAYQARSACTVSESRSVPSLFRQTPIRTAKRRQRVRSESAGHARSGRSVDHGRKFELYARRVACGPSLTCPAEEAAPVRRPDERERGVDYQASGGVGLKVAPALPLRRRLQIAVVMGDSTVLHRGRQLK